MEDADFIAAMRAGLPQLSAPAGLDVIDCTGILLGNADLELSDLERIEGICVLPESWA
ncbi:MULTISPECIES: hypothetical protein [Xanthomonas]|uniref:Uncharacterized protein n=1 Tax=Xanthomonas dyei TaxID=743699 RepID=A0ABZ0D3D0_9XANT|nr:hypothetical protein [Xanthomonas dyei]WOB24778.1 hypothetical protein NYR99_13310 [Xanthomonas dyei]WOB52406.1 hypothetical protein NYR95_13315 [Xanthomonas dyei]